jgi:hypothetical protein
MLTILAPLGTRTGQFLFNTGIRAMLHDMTGLPDTSLRTPNHATDISSGSSFE